VFTSSSAENDILFKNVNVEIHKNNLVVDSERFDAPMLPKLDGFEVARRLRAVPEPFTNYTLTNPQASSSVPRGRSSLDITVISVSPFGMVISPDEPKPPWLLFVFSLPAETGQPASRNLAPAEAVRLNWPSELWVRVAQQP
jgi:hypothetical protein